MLRSYSIRLVWEVNAPIFGARNAPTPKKSARGAPRCDLRKTATRAKVGV
jgi:hypothetical protein